ncbi:TPA: helix-turn-helix domain-containing protein [Vibrio parahaemolyticus]|nr:helix-turn-helix domain-containing protein [Vibrio parahaemolyticus]HBB9976882.1 helix-turn-helix domain-containing protein [Vibrio parahaemolyticus]HBC0013445.1 helix-turn-helix domain-containing protein [Vibrio parahaemolyticus]
MVRNFNPNHRARGTTIGKLAKEFELGRATIYRTLKTTIAKED